ncbi:MAG: penicillin-binding protein 1A [Gammaproteobacteria bacterium]|nr:penicillin-binding protein 1A [Gammaproteobacteria bacterium]
MRNFVWRLTRRLLVLLFFMIAVVVTGILYYIEYQLPDVEALNTVQLQVPLQIYTHDGKLIAEYGERRRIPLPYNQIPQPLIQAVLATEDQRYFQHPGIDIPGLVRASIKLIATGRKEQGGSTITMQVARDFYLTHHKTFGRKLREILLALKIDHTLSKQKILELYLNKIFLGNRAYGVEAASEIYYGKKLNQLSIDQYAMLAGLPKAPSTLNPLANPVAARKRRDHVLSRMYELSYIDEKTYKSALKAPLKASYHDLQTQVKAPYAAELVRQQLEQMYGDTIYTDGFNVYTTIDSDLQQDANQSVRDGLQGYDQRHGYRGPEKNLGAPDLKHMIGWEAALSHIQAINGLEPAAVIEMNNTSVTALRANGSMATIPWANMSWARKQINADYLGHMPRKPSDVLALGDVIRIVSVNNSWHLSQIPKVEGGMVALNPQNGQILAMIGGFDYQNSKFNRITNALRQPGSSFKPFIYSAGLDKGYTLATVINDAPIVIVNPVDNSLWRPQNDKHHFYGPTRLRNALVHSMNLVSIRLLGLIGTSYAINYAQRFGFSAAQLPPSLSLALGTATVTPLDMASGYAVFANGGFKVTPYIIDDIRNSQGQIIYQAKPLTACPSCSMDLTLPITTDKQTAAITPPKPPVDNGNAPRVITPQNAFLISSALRDVIQLGTGREARSLQRADLSGKTGTTNNQIDAWFIGYNSDIVALSWVGFDQPQSLHEYGAQAALPMWIQFMQAALKGRPEHTQEQPPGIISVRIDPLTGTRVSGNDPQAIFEFFMEQNVPSENKEDSPDTESTVPTDSIDAPASPASPEGQEPATTNQTTPEGNGGVY